MRLLLDTHTLIWWATDDASLSRRARQEVEQSPEVLVSAASAWEIAIKFSLGRLPSALDLISDFEESLNLRGFHTLGITAAHGVRAGLLPGPHKDPFDRMLIAQAQAENLTIISNDTVFDGYGVRRLW
ncbi:MAG TPA: type II toxin-antitoxin system VapC family toxin [Terriglobales bacterium]|nr:type II toxin-antitoxin system VapC family toxin [Terriglobales bacterium]